MSDFGTQFANHTTSRIPSDGSSVWLLTQCVGPNCVIQDFGPSIYMDFSGLPFVQGNTPNGTVQFAFLHCQPHLTIATHEIRSDGKGMLSVQPDGDGSFHRQGNLNLPQSGMLLSVALTDFGAAAGPSVPILELGTQAQVEFIFGKSGAATINFTSPFGGEPGPVTKLAPQSLSNITAIYTTMAQAAAKVYMTGTLGTAYVPGRITTPQVVFYSSLPHVIASTFLLVVLSLLVVVAHSRSGKEEQFTLFRVAAALDGSEIPAQFSKDKAGKGFSESKIIKSLTTKLSMASNGDLRLG